MNSRNAPHLHRLALVTALATVVLTSVHHIYRLGAQMIGPAAVMLVLLSGLMLVFHRTGRRSALWGFTAVNVLIFVWFGFVDGFLDHVLKALGLAHVGLLPGSDAKVVETVYSLWSPAAGDVFYEWTGILTFVLGVAALIFNSLLVKSTLQTSAAPAAPRPTATVSS